MSRKESDAMRECREGCIRAKMAEIAEEVVTANFYTDSPTPSRLGEAMREKSRELRDDMTEAFEEGRFYQLKAVREIREDLEASAHEPDHQCIGFQIGNVREIMRQRDELLALLKAADNVTIWDRAFLPENFQERIEAYTLWMK